ncbi:MAG: M28 family peptidase, partial [Planctomycetota bacterium]
LYYGRWSYKYEEAARRGAAGAIVIHTTPSAGYPFQVIQATHGVEAFSLPAAPDEPQLAIESWCSEEAARKLAALGGHDLDKLRTAAIAPGFRPVDLGVTVDLATDNVVRSIETANVVGVRKGSDSQLRDEAILVTAHFDHLGRGRERNGDDIYNGALDNASGCAAVLELARAIGAMTKAPRRSILVSFVTGEESGLLGSRYFATHPTWPLSKIAANFNVDGINIWGRTTDIEMIGHGKNSLTALAEAVAIGRGRRIEPDKQPDLGLFYRSDHFSFAQVGVPSAYFKAGADFVENTEGRRRLKASYTAVNYHQPSDELDPRWRLEGAVDDLRLLTECLLRCANADAAPTWTPGDEFASRR